MADEPARLVLRPRPDRAAGRLVPRPLPRRRAAEHRGVRRQVPRAGRRDPRAAAGPGRAGAEPVARAARRPASLGQAARGRRRRSPAATGRLPDPPRDRPGRDGRRLRGGAAVARPARGAEGAAAAAAWRDRRTWSGSGWRPAPRPGCTTRTSCRSSASASRRACTTTPCSSSRARASTRSSRSCGGCKGSRSAQAAAPAEPSAAAGPARALTLAATHGLLTGRFAAGGGASREPATGAEARRRPPTAGTTPSRDRRCRAGLAPGRRALGGSGISTHSELSRHPGRDAVLSLGRPGRPPGGRGAGLRPRPGDPPPRHQAVEPAARRPGDGLGHRLRPGQGRGDRRPDPHRRHRRHPALHGPRAVRRLVRPAERRLLRWGRRSTSC